MRLQNIRSKWAPATILFLLVLLTGCLTQPESVEVAPLPTLAVAAKLVPETPTPTPENFLLPTFTPIAQQLVVPTEVGQFVYTPIPTNTPFPTLIPTATRTPFPTSTTPPTRTPIPTNTPLPASTSVAATLTPVFLETVVPRPVGTNILFNPSFEDGHYNQNGVPELQLPNNWGFEWDTGRTGFGDEVWDEWVRPEVRVLPKSNVPSSEHNDFFVDGDHAVKIFKGSGAISFRFSQAHQLEAGKYQFTVNVYPDVIKGYGSNGEKIFADDPLAAELSFLLNGSQTAWRVVEIGERNRYAFVFEISEPKTVQVALVARGRFAVENNGWFMDSFSLVKID